MNGRSARLLEVIEVVTLEGKGDGTDGELLATKDPATAEAWLVRVEETA